MADKKREKDKKKDGLEDGSKKIEIVAKGGGKGKDVRLKLDNADYREVLGELAIAKSEIIDDEGGKWRHGRLSTKFYNSEIKKLHADLVDLQRWIVEKKLKVVIIFEGRDGAGKGGAIKAITERVSPRVFQTVALAVPTEREKSQMYFQRYLKHLPSAGEVVIFDRSWYNRAGVERVMGFCTEEEAKDFLKLVPFMERAIVDSGTILIKFWLEVSMEEQERRIRARIYDGRKTWKLSPMDVKSYSRWYDYSRARDEMFLATDTAWAPWTIVNSDDKKRARLNIIQHILKTVPYEKLPVEKVELPKRQKPGDYVEIKYPYRKIEEVY